MDRVHSQDYEMSSMLVVQFGGKKSDCARVCSVFVDIVVCVSHNQSDYPAFRTTKVKDTKLTLGVIPF